MAVHITKTKTKLIPRRQRLSLPHWTTLDRQGDSLHVGYTQRAHPVVNIHIHTRSHDVGPWLAQHTSTHTQTHTYTHLQSLTIMDESWHAYEWVMSHAWMSHVSRNIEKPRQCSLQRATNVTFSKFRGWFFCDFFCCWTPSKNDDRYLFFLENLCQT